LLHGIALQEGRARRYLSLQNGYFLPKYYLTCFGRLSEPECPKYWTSLRGNYERC
jgi:hypothetical protein